MEKISGHPGESLVVGNYELFRVLGEGGIATTYLGRHLSTGRLVALKALHLVKGKRRQQIELFEREAEALRGLRHPQIPEFYETIVDETPETVTLYLVQEFVEGRSLQARLDDGEVFMAPEVVSILLSCLDPLEYLHGQTPPLFHRDIKPSNVIMRDDGTCVLIDFGSVREALADPKVAGSSVVGTFGYMAPEQFQARAAAATDLYSMGATAVHLLTGSSPNAMEMRRLKPDIHTHLHVDPHLAAVLDLLLEPASEDRYQTASSLRRALLRWVGEHRQEFDLARLGNTSTVEILPNKSAVSTNPNFRMDLGLIDGDLNAAGVTRSRIVPLSVGGDEAKLPRESAPAPAKPHHPTLRMPGLADVADEQNARRPAGRTGDREEPLFPTVPGRSESTTDLDLRKARRAAEGSDDVRRTQPLRVTTPPSQRAVPSPSSSGVLPESMGAAASSAALIRDVSSQKEGAASARARVEETRGTGIRPGPAFVADGAHHERLDVDVSDLDITEVSVVTRPGKKSRTPVEHRKDPLFRLFSPSAPGYGHVGTVFFALGLLLFALAFTMQPRPLLAAVGSVCLVYGLAFAWGALGRRSRRNPARYLGVADGQLDRVDLVKTVLGEQYLQLHYRFTANGQVFRGEALFRTRHEARPYLRQRLVQTVCYDARDPRRSTLGKSIV